MPTSFDHHIWQTADGRYVADGDPNAAVLAYPAGHDVPDDVAAHFEDKPKRSRRGADKAASGDGDKA